MKKHLQISNLHIASIFAGIICLISIVFTGVVYAQPLRSNDQHGLNSTPNGTVNYTTLSTDVIRMSFVLSTDNGTGKKGSVMNFNSSILKENGSASFSKILAEDTSMPLEQMMVTPSTPLTLNCPSDITTSVLTGQCNAVVTYTTPSAPPVIPQSTQTFNYTGTIVNWTVPTGVTSITIKSLGARGGNMNGGYSSGTGGNGASIQGEYLVTPGEEIKILVGRKGEDANFRTNVLNTGGGGGSFVWKEVGNTLLISAGGGSGVGTCGYVSQGVHGSATLGGTGNGGQGGNLYCGLDQGGGGGAGWLTNGSGTTSNTNIGGISPLNGGLGGAGGFSAYGFISTAGGFGGGGGGGGNCGGPGGGGGYSGGNGGDNIICQGGQFVQGGTSYNIGINQINQTGINSADGQVTITYGSASYTVTQTAGLPTGSAFPVGTTTNTFEINDGNGNTSTCSFNVTVTDNIDPTITAPAATTGTTNVDCTSTNVILGTPITDDNCSVAVVTNDAPLAFLLGQTIVTWTVTDGSGNTAQATQLVTVSDNIDPTITAPAATTGTTNVACTSTNVVLGTPLTTDNCSVAVVTNDAPLAFLLGQTIVTWTVTDGSGNTAQATQLVTVTDNIDPTITAPAATTGTTNVACTSTNVVLGTPLTTDNCSVALVTNDAPSAFPLGQTTVTWTVTDGSGNTAQATQLVTVTDNIDPTITAPAATTGTTNVACTSTNVVLGTPLTADNCSVALVTNDAPSAFPLGQTTVTWTVTDGSGNTAQATQLVTVTDNIDPTITAPAATTGTTNVACTSTNVVLGTPLTADNCSVALVTNDAPLAFQLGQTTVTWTVTDGSGNTTQATQLVTVTDDIDPTITAPANKTDDTDTGMCTKTFTLAQIGTATAGDNCSVIVSWTRSDNALSLDSPFPFGATTITWKATDGAGNIATSNQTINIEHVITITTVTVTPNSQQYSDKVTFVANVTTCSGAGTIGGTVEFKVGTQVMGSALVLANGTATLADIALLEPSPFGTTPIGQMSPGVKTVTATYSGDANYSGGFGTTNLTITPEVAAVTYNGGSYFTANPSTYQGTIMPSAFLVDAADGSRGDIRNATVTFRDGSVAGSALGLPNIPVGLVNPSITTDGFATTSLNYTLSNSDLNAGGKTWEVWTTAGKYYEGQADAYIPITLGLPGPEYVTGGGNTVMSNSSGIYAGDAGRKMNFGLVMKWNKSGKNLQGNINVIYRREDGNYQIKSNAINSLVIENVDNTGKVVSGSAVTFRRATISTKANFKRLNPDGTYTDLGGNLNLIVTAWESTTVKTGASDRIGLQLAGTNGTGINFSSNWSSGNTVAQQLSGGKIQVQTPTTKSAEIATATEVLPTEPTIKAYPNPFTDKLNIEFSNETNTHARLEIYNVTGSRLETLFDSNIQSGELYNIEYLPKLVSSQMVFYHLILGDKTYVGKAIYNERR